MSEILLRTKLFIPPSRPFLVPRPRLLSKLEAGRQGKLSLVAAPAGFGKTTLVTHWLRQQKQPVAWLSLDENDNQPLLFFTYLVAAVQTVYPHLAENLAAGLRSPAPPEATAVIPAFLNELAAHPDPFILVLDDYHVIHNEEIHTAFAFLIDHMPEAHYVIITSREDPPLPLPRWRVRGQLTDIDAMALRFTIPEARQFLRETMALDLGESAVANLETRTEGWVAGLQLAALSLRNSPDKDRFIAEFVGSDRQVADYLLQEVLLQQPEPVQQFLLQTAVLDRFNAAMCNAVLNQSNSQDILEQLDQSNLFIIPLDNSRYWYRYHHLFAQLLRYRLQRDWPATAVANLHRRAAHWYENEHLLEEAIAHAFQIPDHDEVARLMGTIPMYYAFIDGGSMRILQWGQHLSPEIISRYPYVGLLLAGAALVNGQSQYVYRYLDLLPADDAATRGYQSLFRSILIRNESGDHSAALQLAQQALTAVPEGDDTLGPWAWGQIAVNQYNLGQLEEADEAVLSMRLAIRGGGDAALTMQLQAIELQFLNAMAQGNLHQAEQLCQEGIDQATGNGQVKSPLIGIMYTGLANVYYQWNEMALTQLYVDKALQWAERTGISDLFTYSALIQANLACWRGDAASLRAGLAQFRTRFKDRRMAQIGFTLDRLTAWLWYRMGDLETAVSWANTCGLMLDDTPAFSDFDDYLALAAIRLAECRQNDDKTLLPPLLGLTAKLETLMVSARHVGGLLEALALKALIQDFQGDAAAGSTLQQAVDLAQPGGMLRPFLDWGRPMQQLVARVAIPDSSFAQRLLVAFAAEEAGAVAPVVPAAAMPVLHLTAREDEILQLIAAGLANKQIQQTLFISKNTVRTHIKNLYSKLGVNSRTQAIKQARAFNLLS